MGTRVLVVSKNAALREQLAHWLKEAGYQATDRADFMSARHELDTGSPDLLIADVRLSAYNGLHLVIWTRGHGMATKSILIGEPDSVLQREADREGALYLSPPLQHSEFTRAVSALMGRHRPARRSPRKPANLGVFVDGVEGTIVDLSDEGLQLELRHVDGQLLPAFFTAELRDHQRSYRLKRVWVARAVGNPTVLRCGAELPMPDSVAAASWRRLVHSLPDLSASLSSLSPER